MKRWRTLSLPAAISPAVRPNSTSFSQTAVHRIVLVLMVRPGWGVDREKGWPCYWAKRPGTSVPFHGASARFLDFRLPDSGLLGAVPPRHVSEARSSPDSPTRKCRILSWRYYYVFRYEPALVHLAPFLNLMSQSTTESRCCIMPSIKYIEHGKDVHTR